MALRIASIAQHTSVLVVHEGYQRGASALEAVHYVLFCGENAHTHQQHTRKEERYTKHKRPEQAIHALPRV